MFCFFNFLPVAGVELEPTMAQTEFNNIMHFYCADNETLHCYMLDDNGFIVSSNQPTIQVNYLFLSLTCNTGGSVLLLKPWLFSNRTVILLVKWTLNWPAVWLKVDFIGTKNGLTCRLGVCGLRVNLPNLLQESSHHSHLL